MLTAMGFHCSPPVLSQWVKCVPLTQHYEADGAPVVLRPGLHFTAVLPGVAQRQVADEQRGITL